MRWSPPMSSMRVWANSSAHASPIQRILQSVDPTQFFFYWVHGYLTMAGPSCSTLEGLGVCALCLIALRAVVGLEPSLFRSVCSL